MATEAHLSAPSDGSHDSVSSLPMVAFRATFGVLMGLATLRYVLRGYAETQLLSPQIHFTYWNTAWWGTVPREGVAALLALQGASAFALAAGVRGGASVFLAAFTALELIDRTTYLNHYYLVSCIALLFVLTPRVRLSGRNPFAILLAFRAQYAVVYVFAGLAKLDTDWLLRAQPMRIWLSTYADVPHVGALLALPGFARTCAWLGLLFDLAVVPGLCLRKTRPYAVVCALVFHGLTGLLFPIGMFPWIMSAGLLLYLPVAHRARGLRASLHHLSRGVVLHCALQIALPLYRQIAYPDAAWTARGFDFAWKVMVSHKVGRFELFRRERDGGATRIALGSVLTPAQEQAVALDPDMICALARALSLRDGTDEGAIFSRSAVSLNGWPSAPLLTPGATISDTECPLAADIRTRWSASGEADASLRAAIDTPASHSFPSARGIVQK